MKPQHTIIYIVLVSASTCAQQASAPHVAAQVGPKASVRSLPGLAVPAGSSAVAELDRPWDDAFGVVLLQSRQRMVLHSCRDFIRLPLDGFDAENEGEWNALWNVGARCVALDWVASAQPAKVSFLIREQTSATFLKALPPFMALALSGDEARSVNNAVGRCEEWGTYDPKLEIADGSGGRLTIRGDGWDGAITEYARGDFNLDGYEDVLLRRDASPTGGSLFVTSLYAITRLGPGECFRVVRRLR